MNKLPAYPTKNEEIAFYTEIVQSLPKSSYLYPMLSAALNQVENNIRNDFTFDPIGKILEDQKLELDRLADLRRQTAEAESNLRKLVQQKNSLTEKIEEIKSAARRIANS